MRNILDAIGWKSLLLLLPVLFFASCGGGEVTAIVPSQQQHWVPVYDSAGKITHNVLSSDSECTVNPYFGQRVKIAKHNGTLTWCYVFGALCLGLLIFGLIQTIRAQKSDYILLVYPILSIISGGIAASSVDWAHTKQFTIKQSTYDSAIKADGSIKKYIDAHLYE